MIDHRSPAGPVSGPEHRQLLQSIVEVARAIFGAAASSIFLLDQDAGNLIFEAVAGQGEGFLVGQAFPASAGIAGWVLTSGEPIIVDDLTSNPRFARDIAEATGYVPRTLMAAPLMHNGDSLGVLEVLDHQSDARRALGDLELLGLFASQAAIALAVIRLSQAANAGSLDGTPLAGVALALNGLSGPRRQAGDQLLASIQQVLTAEA
jgi:GAF domain-containing protein